MKIIDPIWEQAPEQYLGPVVKPLLQWYQENKRSMPWREDPTPYHVWLSEIMLQQTRVEAVRAYYTRFLAAAPDIRALAQLPEEQLLKLWEGLGYYSRVRNLQKAAKLVVEEYGGALPADYDALRKLPGIGAYTAGAVASIAFGLPYPAVDGNVLRVVSRWLADGRDITKQKEKRRFEAYVQALMPQDDPGDFNQALMELGATVCLPNGLPDCARCPAAFLCRAKIMDRQMEFPVKPAKKPRRIEEKNVWMLEWDGKLFLRKRPDSGLLAGLWEFPNDDASVALDSFLAQCMVHPLSVRRLSPAKHIFTHVEWHMTGYWIVFGERPYIKDGVWADRNAVESIYSLPGAFRHYDAVLGLSSISEG